MPAKGARNPAYVYKNKHPYILKVCAGCGEEKLIRTTGEFCSRGCSLRAQHAAGPRAEMPSGSDHYAWKESGASYVAHHNRVLHARGKADHCELRAEAGCRSRKYEWAHTHGTAPGDPANYRALCKSCHQIYDGQVGESHASAKLTFQQAQEIRARYAYGVITQAALAAEYGVEQTTISNVVLNRHYREPDVA